MCLSLLICKMELRALSPPPPGCQKTCRMAPGHTEPAVRCRAHGTLRTRGGSQASDSSKFIPRWWPPVPLARQPLGGGVFHPSSFGAHNCDYPRKSSLAERSGCLDMVHSCGAGHMGGPHLQGVTVLASSCMDNTVKNLSKDGVSGLGWLCVLWCMCRNMAICVCMCICVCPCMYAYVGKFVCLYSMCLHNVCVCPI